MLQDVEPPPLHKCVLSLKQLSHGASRHNTPKEQAELYLSAVGLLCHLKEDQATLQQAWKSTTKQNGSLPCPSLDRLPAMAAVIQDPNLFHALLACLRAPPLDLDGSSPFAPSTPGDNTTPNVHSHGRIHPSQALTHPSQLLGRKRSLSVSRGETDSIASKSMKLHHHSPMPNVKKNLVYPEANGDKKRVLLNVRVVAATILYTSLQHLDHWPAPLLRAYSEDCFGPRSWVDDDRCILLTKNLALTHSEKSDSLDGEDSPKRMQDAEKVANFYVNFKASEDGTGPSPVPSRPRSTTSGSFELDGSLPVNNTIISPGNPEGTRAVTAESHERDSRVAYSSDSDSGDEEECIVEVSTGTATDNVASKSDVGTGDSSSSGEEDIEVVEMADSFADGESTAMHTSDSSPQTPISPHSLVPTYPVSPEFLNLDRVRQRYFGLNLTHAREAIADSLSDRLDAKFKQNSRLLLALPSFVSLPEVRRLTARHLERWMQSPALSGPARTLFAATVSQMRHVDPPLPADIEAIDSILRMRLKANQLNAHIENITNIAKSIPTASIARHLFLQLLREELATIDTSGDTQSLASAKSDQLRMASAIRSVLSPSLASDGLAAALLTLLANPTDEKVTHKSGMTRQERHVLVKKIRLLIRKVASAFGPSHFDGCRLVESLLSFDVDAESWTVEDEEDKGRLMFECITLLTAHPSSNLTETRLHQTKSQRKVAQRVGENTIPLRSDEDITTLRKKLVVARKLLLSWCCSDYAPMYQSARGTPKRKGADLRTQKGRQQQMLASAGAGTPDFSSILDGKSDHNESSISCLDVMRCVLFMVDPESPLLYSFLHPDEHHGSLGNSHFQEEYHRIQQCCEYGSDLDDEMMRIVLQSAAQPETGIDPGTALSLFEYLFESCRKGRSGVLRLSDSKLVWCLYELVEYTPSLPAMDALSSENGTTENTDNNDAYKKLVSGVMKQENESDKRLLLKEEKCPRLAYPGMWWRATSIALIMCGVSPNRIGAEMWSKHPTLQALIKMVTSNRYRFPTVDCDEEMREAMKASEAAMRDEESSVTELLFFNSTHKPKKKTVENKAASSIPRGSRISARQRAKQEKLRRAQREKEEAEALAAEQRRRKLLRAAQKSIMLWEPKRAARKPPRESVDLILSVAEMFGLSEIFQQSTTPDFVLMTIGDTSRQSVERAYDWLIPVTSSLPGIINRLPASASCFLLLRAYGAEGEESNELRELSAPLLVHVSESLTGKFGQEDSIRAADLLLADVTDRNPDRRRCARRVLQEALSSLNTTVEDSTLAAADCAWLFSILKVQDSQALIAHCIKYISRGLAYERGTVLRAFVLALRRYVDFAKQSDIEGRWDFPAIVYTLISSRRNVCSEAMERFPDFCCVTVTVVHMELKAFVSRNSERKLSGEDVAVQITPCGKDAVSSSKTDDGSHQITIPAALLFAACVILSNWREQREHDAAHQQADDAICDMLDLLLCVHDSDASSTNESGLASAIFLETGKKALSVDQWVMLAKSRADFIARRAALSAPTTILPRLLMCSGLPRTSLVTMVDRVGKLGEQGANEAEVFSQLLVPSVTTEWGTVYAGSRRDVSRKLLGRLSAYLRTKPDGEGVISNNFLRWLARECRGQEKSRKPKQKRSPRAGSTCLSNLKTLKSVLSDLTAEVPSPLEKPSAHVTNDMPNNAVTLRWQPKSAEEELPEGAYDATVAKSFIERCFQTNGILSMERWLQRVYQDQTLPGTGGSRQITKHAVSSNDLLSISLVLLEAQSGRSVLSDGLTNIILKWVPLLTQTEGSEPLWAMMFRPTVDSSQELWRLLLCRCASVWRQHHISACQNWILFNFNGGLNLSPQRMVRFLVLTSGQHSVHIQAFSSRMEKMEPFASETEQEVTAGVSLALECLKQSDPSEKTTGDIDSRNDLPDWVTLLLLLARRGKKYMKSVTDTILMQVPQVKGYARQLLCSSVLRLYSYFPRTMNLGNPELRSLLVEAASSLGLDWRDWRSPLDEQLDDMLSSLQANPHQRLVQALRDLSKDHPLLILRKIPEFVCVLEKDGGSSPSRTHASDRWGRLQGEDLRASLQAKINGKKVKVTIRHWGCSFSEGLWISVVDIMLMIPHEVLCSCGLAMGLQDLFCVYVRLLFLQSQLQNGDKESRLRSRLSEMLSVFRSSNSAAWDQWCSNPMPGLEGQGTTRDVLSRCRMDTLTKPGDEISGRSQ